MHLNSQSCKRIHAILFSKDALISVGLFFIAFMPRLFWALEEHPRPFSDMEDYYLCAVNWLKGNYLAMSEDRLAYRAPLYPLFLAGCIRAFPGHGLMAIRLVQSVVGSLSVVILYFLARAVLRPAIEKNERFGLAAWVPFAASATLAFSTGHIFFSSVMMTETIFVFLLLSWCGMAFYVFETKSYPALIAFSVLLGVMALLRPAALVFIPVMVFISLRLVPRALWRTRLLPPLVSWAFPILPWTIRNFVVLASFVLISSNSGVNFYIGHNPYFGYYATGQKEPIRQEIATHENYDEVYEDRYFFREGLRYIIQEPGRLLSRSMAKLYFLFWLDKEPWPWEEYPAKLSGPFYPQSFQPQIWWNPIWFWLALAGITYAFIRRLNHGLLISLIALHTFACLVYFARTRFRMPIEPFLILYAWMGLLSLAETAKWVYVYFAKLKNTPEPKPETQHDPETDQGFGRVNVRRAS